MNLRIEIKPAPGVPPIVEPVVRVCEGGANQNLLYGQMFAATAKPLAEWFRERGVEVVEAAP